MVQLAEPTVPRELIITMVCLPLGQRSKKRWLMLFVNNTSNSAVHHRAGVAKKGSTVVLAWCSLPVCFVLGPRSVV